MTKTLGQVAFEKFYEGESLKMDILDNPWNCLKPETQARWEAIAEVVRGRALQDFFQEAADRPRRRNLMYDLFPIQQLPAGARVTYERDLDVSQHVVPTCEQCLNPLLKGIHTCGSKL